MHTKSAVLAFAIAAATGDAFIAPTLPSASRTSTTSMMAQSNNGKASAAAAASVIAAGVLLQGAFVAPSGAAMFDVAAPTQIERSVGFGSPNPSEDPKNNNAASGKVNDNKYDAQQQGSFAKKFAQGNAADYGSPKGTDFGPTAGSNSAAASNEKATDGKFQASAEKPQNQGVIDIAGKKVSDAANVDVKSVVKDPSAARGPTLESATNALNNKGKDVKTAAAKAAPRWGKWGGAVKDAAKDAVASRDDGVAPTRGSDPGAGFGFGVIPSPEKVAQSANNLKNEVAKNDGLTAKAGKGPASIGVTASSPADAIASATKSGKNIVAAATGAATEGGDNGNNAVTRAATTAGQKVSGGGSEVASAAKNKVQGDVDAVKQGVASAKSSDVGQQAQQKVGDAASAAKNKVSSDVNSVQDGLASAKDSAPKAGGFFGTDPKGQADTVGQKTVDKVKSDINSVSSSNILSANIADDAANAIKSKVSSDVNSAKSAASNAQDSVGSAANAAKGKVASDVASVQSSTPKVGGFFGTEPKQQADAVGRKTVEKVQSDIDYATGRSGNTLSANIADDAADAIKSKVSSNVNSAKNAASNAQDSVGSAANAAKGKVASDVASVQSSTPKVGGFFGTEPKQQADAVGRKTVDKVKSDIDYATGRSGNTLSANIVTDAADAVKSKVSSDVDSAKSTASNAGSKVASDIDSVQTPKVGGFFGTEPKQQADQVGAKTVAKVKSDVNAVKGGVPSYGNDVKNAVKNLAN